MNQRSNKAKSTPPMNNQAIASQLERIAELLEAQDANPFRVRAYREAAQTLRNLGEPAHVLLGKEGIEGLRRLPNIGESISRSIEQLIHTGKINLLEQLRGETSPEQVLATVPGIGPKLASRIHEQLGIETLADLEATVYDGRLEQVAGFGRERLRGVRESLAGRLHRRPSPALRLRPPSAAEQPPVEELLDLDREYRQQAQANRLPKIAPRRFNPTGQAWLPILHTEHGKSHYTVLFSNTARAHELGATRDWVVIYRDDHDGAGQWTVVTARYGTLQGKRVVRGREHECEGYYASHKDEA
ncbi:MAG: helix-hairpin-helix domain-containing protein [Caldilinea sp.]